MFYKDPICGERDLLTELFDIHDAVCSINALQGAANVRFLFSVSQKTTSHFSP